MEARLQEIDALGAQKALRRVLRRVAKPLLERAKANASTVSQSGSSGALARSLIVQTRKERPQQVARVAVTSQAKNRVAVYLHNAFYQRSRKGVFYGWMVDQGHRAATGKGRLVRESTALTKKGFDRYERRRARAEGERGRIRGSRSWGTVKARPWWSPAVSASEPAMTTDMVKEMTRALKLIERRKAREASTEIVPP
jgi:hypothetical protein